jgi:hypothetical protein
MQNTQIPWHTAEFTSGRAIRAVEEGAGEGINHRGSGVKLNSEGKKPLSLLRSRSKMLWCVHATAWGDRVLPAPVQDRGDRWPCLKDHWGLWCPRQGAGVSCSVRAVLPRLGPGSILGELGDHSQVLVPGPSCLSVDVMPSQLSCLGTQGVSSKL